MSAKPVPKLRDGEHIVPVPVVTRASSDSEDRSLSQSCRDILSAFRAAIVAGTPADDLVSGARAALLHLGGAPDPSSASLRHYDPLQFGPFLGVSDDGSAAADIRDAALTSPKARALRLLGPASPLDLGVAVDAERLGGIGEVAVGPEEYASVWLACVDRALITTNVGTRVNVRVYRRDPRIMIRSTARAALAEAQRQLVETFRPFVETPDGEPRPLTVLVEFPPDARMTVTQKRATLVALREFVKSGRAAGRDKALNGHALGLHASVREGLPGQASALAAIDLASNSGIEMVVLEGIRRPAADQSISLAGLLDYFEPGIVGPMLRRAAAKGVELRAANLPDTDTIARSIWVGLTTARRMGANLGKYGCFPLTLSEVDHVVEQIQRWLPNWSAAPVFFVDQGLLRATGVDVGSDLTRGIKAWLDVVGSHGVRVVLIDTIDKSLGKRLLRKSSKDPMGWLGPQQIRGIESHARTLGVSVLWAGGLGLRDAFEMGRLGVFGIYVTSAAATTVPVAGSYVRDPALAGVKRPTREAVLRTKILLEAGFLCERLPADPSQHIRCLATALLATIDFQGKSPMQAQTQALADACELGWTDYWKSPKQPAGHSIESEQRGER